MSKLFNVGKSLYESQKKDEQKQAEGKAAESHDLVGPGGYMTVVKYAAFTVLAALNIRLFLESLHYGVWGVAVGLVAVLTEGTAIYCWRNQIRTAGSHRTGMIFFAVAFTAISLAHAFVSFLELCGAAKDLEKTIYVYSYFVAFPLMFGMLVLCVCTLFLLHWQTKISKERARAQTEIAKSNAELQIEKANLRQSMEIEESRLDHLKAMVGMENQYVESLEDLVVVKERQQQALARISDPEIRDEIFAVLGRIAQPTQSKRINPLPSAASTSQAPNAQTGQK